MKFYRNLAPFKVITFDLDDTLYDNHQVILQAEQACVDFLKVQSQIAELDLNYWKKWKAQIAKKFPLLEENVTQWRKVTICELLTFHGFPEALISSLAEKTMEHFLAWRHEICVPLISQKVLNQLAQRYSLAVITNGNVDPKRINLHQFSLIRTGGIHGRAKPHNDLFSQTADYFKVRKQEILHIGDNLITDVEGAIKAGCQAVWLNESRNHLHDFNEARILPTVEIHSLKELLNLS